MLLSELQTGERGVVVRVSGHGAFRKRIIEMGFIKGVTVEAILNAPLKDPIKYRVLNFEVSLRRSDAMKVEIVTEQEARQEIVNHDDYRPLDNPSVTPMQHIAAERSKTINVALVGNPNCGKTSIFNIAAHAHERVGNYSGVTVDEKVGTFTHNGYTFNLVDLPGTYSLSAYSPEELYVRRHILEKNPDIILNVVDGSNLHRNLYLTTQLIDMDITMVMALNMYDELKKSGDRLDINQLSTLLGMPIVPTTGRSGDGIDRLFDTIIDVFESNQPTQTSDLKPQTSDLPPQTSHLYRHIHVNHGPILEPCISRLRTHLYEHGFSDDLSTRFLAIKLLENDHQLEQYVADHDPDGSVLRMRNQIAEEYQKSNTHTVDDAEHIRREHGGDTHVHQDIESAITDAKYAFVRGALAECYVKNEKSTLHALTDKIDAIVTHRWLGYPVFLVFMFVTFWCTFALGQYPMDWIEALFGWLGEAVTANMSDGPLRSLLADGIIGGVGSVIVFLPNILILYLFISFMEDSGYMARAAFIMDKLMHRMGLHGKSFIPMIMGFGCNVPAIMATRTIEDRRSRLLTMLVIPMMSCSARIPVYVILVSAFFSQYAAYVLMGLYVFGLIMAVLMAKLFSRFVVRGESLPFVMELPPYRMPTAKAVLRHTWEKGKEYLKKMGTIILGASIIVWALSYFPYNEDARLQAENSYMAKIGKTIEPVMRPCGFDWRQSVSLLSGVFAKEVVASTMGVLYSTSEIPESSDYSESSEYSEYSESSENSDDDSLRISRLIRGSMTPLSAASMLLFILLYMPCLSTVIAIRNESGRWKWALFTMAYTIGLAWLVSTLFFQLGSLLL
ncbi:MAG: ferrous iron transport protein B [Bacteroidales bacterium]|nr:ferrous iron transport protein B [Bacteroidales bacterium]